MPQNIPLLVLDKTTIAHPCTQPWVAMAGDERRRFCDSCGKHVHNLSAMTRAEAESLVSCGDKLCIKMTLDSKGRLKTRDDQPTRRRWLGRIAAMCAALGMTLGGCEKEVWGDYCDPNDPQYRYTGGESSGALTPATLRGMTFICRDVARDSADAVLETWTLTFRDGTVEWDRAGRRETGLVSIDDDGKIHAQFHDHPGLAPVIDWTTRDLLWDGKVYVPLSQTAK